MLLGTLLQTTHRIQVEIDAVDPALKIPCPVCGVITTWGELLGHLECPKCREPHGR